MCGVVGILSPPSRWNNSESWDSIPTESSASDVAHDIYRGLLTLQHRGQDAAGILSYDHLTNRFHIKKSNGFVSNVFEASDLKNLEGPMAIGHTRYATVGGGDENNIQPLVTGHPFGLGMVHNGNLVNYHKLKERFHGEFRHTLLTDNDIEVILHAWAHSLREVLPKDTQEFSPEKGLEAAKMVSELLVGAYAVVGLLGGQGLFGMRDPQGLRPLVLGKKLNTEGKASYCLASETVTLNFLEFEYERDIFPGEFIFINLEGEVFSSQACSKVDSSPCMFEWVYFSGAESTLENQSVYSVRLRLGQQLAYKAKKELDSGKIKADIVVPVPDTSRTAAIALAEELGLPYREGLIKNRYVQRSFILSGQKNREKAVSLKLSPIRSEIEGKNILLVDDSVVRGTTSKRIIQLLKSFGAKQITLAVSCPPIRFGCFYGIDFPDHEELVANNKNTDQIAEHIGANHIIYLEEDDLLKAIGLPKLCMACLNGKYPTSIEEGEHFALMRKKERKKERMKKKSKNIEV